MVEWFDHFLGFHGPRKDRFPGQQAGEEVELLTTQHWASLFPFSFVLFLFILTTVLVNVYILPYFEIPHYLLFSINSVVVALLVHVFALRMFNYFLDVLIITNYRIIDIRHTVYLKRERDTIDLANIQDIRFQQSGIWPRLLNYGVLELYGANVDVEYRIQNIPDVEKLHSIICHIHRKAVIARQGMNHPTNSLP